MKATLEFAQTIRRAVMDQAAQDGCLNSEKLDERILGVLVMAEQRAPREVKTAYNSPQLTDAELLRYLAYLSS